MKDNKYKKSMLDIPKPSYWKSVKDGLFSKTSKHEDKVEEKTKPTIDTVEQYNNLYNFYSDYNGIDTAYYGFSPNNSNEMAKSNQQKLKESVDLMYGIRKRMKQYSKEDEETYKEYFQIEGILSSIHDEIYNNRYSNSSHLKTKHLEFFKKIVPNELLIDGKYFIINNHIINLSEEETILDGIYISNPLFCYDSSKIDKDAIHYFLIKNLLYKDLLNNAIKYISSPSENITTKQEDKLKTYISRVDRKEMKFNSRSDVMSYLYGQSSIFIQINKDFVRQIVPEQLFSSLRLGNNSLYDISFILTEDLFGDVDYSGYSLEEVVKDLVYFRENIETETILRDPNLHPKITTILEYIKIYQEENEAKEMFYKSIVSKYGLDYEESEKPFSQNKVSLKPSRRTTDIENNNEAISWDRHVERERELIFGTSENVPVPETPLSKGTTSTFRWAKLT